MPYEPRRKLDGHFQLACAIIYQAITDYKAALLYGDENEQKEIDEFMYRVAPDRWSIYRPKLRRTIKPTRAKTPKPPIENQDYRFDFDIQNLDTLEIGQRLKEAREALNIPIRYEGTMTPVTRSTLVRYERGHFRLTWPYTNASMKTIKKMAAYYGTDLNYILYGGNKNGIQ